MGHIYPSLSTRDMMTMCGVSVLLPPLLSLTVASPVLQPNLETDQDRFDFIDSLRGVTTTPKPGLFDWWPNNGGWFGFGLFGKTTTTTPPPTTTKCGGLIGLGLFCDDSEDTTLPEVTTPVQEVTTTKCGGLIGLGLFCDDSEDTTTTTKCGGLLGGGLLFC